MKRSVLINDVKKSWSYACGVNQPKWTLEEYKDQCSFIYRERDTHAQFVRQLSCMYIDTHTHIHFVRQLSCMYIDTHTHTSLDN